MSVCNGCSLPFYFFPPYCLFCFAFVFIPFYFSPWALKKKTLPFLKTGIACYCRWWRREDLEGCEALHGISEKKKRKKKRNKEGKIMYQRNQQFAKQRMKVVHSISCT
uniref:Uncharacterized protein n=1 Tax=Trypanosoma congolense (strain IL3000) TaxID=1068625 RepID=G0ULQ4_TRYCI|nr:hypothetical protein, unlikely [Trypanosoma congolense IL3000]